MNRFCKIPADVIKKLPSPCYILSSEALIENLKKLRSVHQQSGAKILLALKAFSMFHCFETIEQYLQGISASSLNELRLGREYFKGQHHIVSPGYRDDEFEDIVKYADHIVFNSLGQLEKFTPAIANSQRDIQVGLRVNPMYSEIKVDLYNPCLAGSHLGITAEKMADVNLADISGLHFHAMCEQNSDTLSRILEVFERDFGKYIQQMKWVNFGGGHHITRQDYDIKLLCELISSFRKRYDNIDVYLEPGEAVALNAGLLVSSVLDVIPGKDCDIVILDSSAACHMPDVLEMPYRPEIIGSGKTGEKKYNYKLAGPTCLAGDVIGRYSFDEPLQIGQKLCFTDMAHYTMVKNNTFNGINLPSIAYYDNQKDKLEIVRTFSYEDFKSRL